MRLACQCTVVGDCEVETKPAMNISGSVTRTSEPDLIKKVLPQLQATANKINAALRMRRN